MHRFGELDYRVGTRILFAKFLLFLLLTSYIAITSNRNQALHNNVKVEKAISTQSDRSTIISKLPPAISKPLAAFNTSLNTVKTADEFGDLLESISGVCQLLLKKLDKQKEK